MVRNGRFERLLIQRDREPIAVRLGSRSVGRVVEINPGLGAAFLDLGAGSPAFLPLPKGQQLAVGQKLDVIVVSEPRGTKGATLRLLGEGQGEPRLLQPGPDVATQLAALAPDAGLQTGLAAIRAGMEAAEEALSSRFLLSDLGLDLSVERTRAMITVDIDHDGTAGRKGRDRANLEGLRQAARLIRLKSWGGLVAIDLVGSVHDAKTIGAAARGAFGADPQIVYGPLNRFGVMQLAMPWRERPVSSSLLPDDTASGAETSAIALVREARATLLSNTTVPRYRVTCGTAEAAFAKAWLDQLGPRVGVVVDPALRAGEGSIQEG
nr:ribonuclease E/G [Brevundimonas variabilis]